VKEVIEKLFRVSKMTLTASAGEGIKKLARVSNWMMTRWSTDACRRDPSIVSSNLTDPTFSNLISPCFDIFIIYDGYIIK